jgi:hypothetical protein
LWTTIFDTSVQYALHFSYLQVIARKRDGEAPITNRRSVDMHSLEGNNGERCLYSRWDAGTAVLRKWQGCSKLESAGCASYGMGLFSFETPWRTLQGYEAMDMLRKGQIDGVEKGDSMKQVAFIASLLGVAV